jgi:glycosyltransferase involved in cell wall biosynthesis
MANADLGEARPEGAVAPIRFSVVIAAFNERERVLEAIESVARQTTPAHEIIVVDDGSSDGTAEAVRTRYESVIVVGQPNHGKGVARNHGAFIATGDWLCFLDHDDLWHPEKLSTVDAYLRSHPDAIAIDHPVWIFREEDTGPDSAWRLQVDFTARTLDDAIEAMQRLGSPRNDFAFLSRNGRSYDAALRRIFSTTSALTMRRDVFFKAGGFHPAHANGEDWALTANVARLGEWHTLPQALSCQRFLPSGGTRDPAGLTMIMSTLVNHWYSGRPLREHTPGYSFLKDLERYRYENRWIAQTAIWSNLRRGRRRGAWIAVWFSMLLLPRWRDRLYALTPVQVTWRLDRWIAAIRRRA